MFNLFNNYEPIQDSMKDLRDKVRTADKKQKFLIHKLFIAGIIMMLAIGVIQLFFILVFREDIASQQQPTVKEHIVDELPEDSGVLDLPEEELQSLIEKLQEIRKQI